MLMLTLAVVVVWGSQPLDFFVRVGYARLSRRSSQIFAPAATRCYIVRLSGFYQKNSLGDIFPVIPACASVPTFESLSLSRSVQLPYIYRP